MKNLWRGLALVVVAIVAVLACDRPEPHRLGAYVPPSTFISSPSDPGEGALLVYHRGAWSPLDAGSSGFALVSSGLDAAPSYASLSLLTGVRDTLPAGNGGGGWITALDFNFATISTQTLSTDGTYVLGGLTWTKANTAHESSAMVITNGTGITITPGASSSYISANTRTAPILSTPIGGFQSITGSTALRVWARFRTITGFPCSGATTAQYYGAGIECVHSSRGVLHLMAKGSTVGGCDWAGWDFSAGGLAATIPIPFTNNFTTHDTALFTMPNGIFAMYGDTIMSGSYSSGFPAATAMGAEATLAGAGSSNVDQSPIGLATSCALFVMGMNSNASAVATTGTIDEIRVDYRL